jgi:hypothetical protein
MRHFDFERIHNEFCKYYKDPRKGENEYYSWVNAMRLDESRPYGQSRESFTWAKDMLRYLKEDSNAKYYGVIVGLPIRSMNNNVYRERDLIAAALTLKGKHPSLNHNDAYWFNNTSRYGTLTVEDAKYEDGAVEAVLKVPKNAVCPTNGSPMTDLIDRQKIVNVSLEGNNDGAFEFTDPPFTLLTSDVLPGIPLARIKPLERIVSEAFQTLQSSIYKERQENKKMVIKARVIEDAVNTKTTGNPDFRGETDTPITADNQIDSQNDLAKTAVGGSVPDNYTMNKNPDAKPPNTEAAVPDRNIDSPSSGPASDTKTPKPEDITSGPTKNKAPERTIPSAGALPHTPDHAKTVTGSNPAWEELVTNLRSEVLEERKQRFKAQDQIGTASEQAKQAVETATKWESRYTEMSNAYTNLEGKTAQLQTLLDQSTTRKEEAIRDMYNIAAEKDKFKAMRDEAAGERDDARRALENLQRSYKSLDDKYNDSLQKNLVLSQKLTSANEEYLEVAKKLDASTEALSRSKNEAKKIIRIQA